MRNLLWEVFLSSAPPPLYRKLKSLVLMLSKGERRTSLSSPVLEPTSIKALASWMTPGVSMWRSQEQGLDFPESSKIESLLSESLNYPFWMEPDWEKKNTFQSEKIFFKLKKNVHWLRQLLIVLIRLLKSSTKFLKTSNVLFHFTYILNTLFS